MLTCKINKPKTYIVTRETTSAVHLKARNIQVLCSSVSIKCWITLDWVLEPSPAWQQNGRDGVAGKSCKLGNLKKGSFVAPSPSLLAQRQAVPCHYDCSSCQRGKRQQKVLEIWNCRSTSTWNIFCQADELDQIFFLQTEDKNWSSLGS